MTGPIEFACVDPSELDEHWPAVAPALVAMDRGPGYEPSVRAMVQRGEALLFIVADGFFITIERFDTDRERKELFVLAAATFPHSTNCCNVATYEPLLVRLAKACGASALVERSSHRGMGRLLGPKWSVAHVEHVMEISDVVEAG